MRRTGTVVATVTVMGAIAALGGAAAYGGGLPGLHGLLPADHGSHVAGQDAPRQVTDPPAQRGRPLIEQPATGPTKHTEPSESSGSGRPAHPVRRVSPAKPDAPAESGGPVLFRPGDAGDGVREVQARLRQIAWFYGDVTDFYGDQTREAVAGFQAKRGFAATGVVDQRTLTRLEEMSSEPTADELANVEPDPADGAPLDPRCLTGRALCIDKSSSSLRWVVDGDVQVTLDARFGGNGHFTREGLFSVYRKSRDHVSTLYETSMPFAMFFSGGEAVHYSPDFAANGYYGASHGCVNIRDYDEMAALFDEVQLGDKVVVYWS